MTPSIASKRTVLIPLTLIVGLFLWFSAECQPQQNKPADTQNASRISGTLVAQNDAAPAAPADGAAAAPAAAPAPGEQGTTISIQDLISRAEANETWAMMILANLYQSNTNAIKQNFGNALAWFQKAAAAGVTEAYLNIGDSYELGLGTAPDINKAVENFQLASEKGLAQADFKLATLYLNGIDIPQDPAKGLVYLDKAVKANFNAAIMLQGAILYSGLFGQARDLTKAKDFFQAAANQGNPVAMLRLGTMNNAGEGLEVNKAQALKWFLLAKEFGSNAQDLQTTIDGLRAPLKAEEITQVETEAKQFADKLRADAAAANEAARAARQAAAEVGAESAGGAE
ncbi:MAG: sel1 repeat family protein [Deltaproteobacteria bacterium]|jgi:TPR repeat protein|nr:sel1 repeat family protein [Deltaproteobacteria bacterium]